MRDRIGRIESTLYNAAIYLGIGSTASLAAEKYLLESGEAAPELFATGLYGTMLSMMSVVAGLGFTVARDVREPRLSETTTYALDR